MQVTLAKGAPTLAFTVLEDGGSGTWKWISKRRFHNGDFDYYFVIEVIDMWDACGRDAEDQPQYHASVKVVSPQAAGPDGINKALGSWGIDLVDEPVKDWPRMMVMCLESYGIAAHIWQKAGSNRTQLYRLAREQATGASSMFGFFMDQHQNAIGDSGWDWVKGDIGRGLSRVAAVSYSRPTERLILSIARFACGVSESEISDEDMLARMWAHIYGYKFYKDRADYPY